MNIRTIASIAALSLAALGFAQASAGAAEDERFRQGGTGRAAQPAPAQRVAPPQGRAFNPGAQAAPAQRFAPRQGQVGNPGAGAFNPGARAGRPAGPPEAFRQPNQVFRQAAPTYRPAPGRVGAPNRGYRGAGPGYAPRFLGHAHRQFWHGRWIWLGAPLAGVALDPCWQRLYTDYGWGWYYTCGYDPNSDDAPDSY